MRWNTKTTFRGLKSELDRMFRAQGPQRIDKTCIVRINGCKTTVFLDSAFDVVPQTKDPPDSDAAAQAGSTRDLVARPSIHTEHIRAVKQGQVQVASQPRPAVSQQAALEGKPWSCCLSHAPFTRQPSRHSSRKTLTKQGSNDYSEDSRDCGCVSSTQDVIEVIASNHACLSCFEGFAQHMHCERNKRYPQHQITHITVKTCANHYPVARH